MLHGLPILDFPLVLSRLKIVHAIWLQGVNLGTLNRFGHFILLFLCRQQSDSFFALLLQQGVTVVLLWQRLTIIKHLLITSLKQLLRFGKLRLNVVRVQIVGDHFIVFHLKVLVVQDVLRQEGKVLSVFARVWRVI